MTFTSKLCVVESEFSSYEWVLSRRLIYSGRDHEFLIPAGFQTDFASVPRPLWVLFPPYGKYTKAAVVHDWLYVERPVSRKDADGIFRRIMRELGVPWWRRYLMWAAVRIGGWFIWKDGKARKGGGRA